MLPPREFVMPKFSMISQLNQLKTVKLVTTTHLLYLMVPKARFVLMLTLNQNFLFFMWNLGISEKFIYLCSLHKSFFSRTKYRFFFISIFFPVFLLQYTINFIKASENLNANLSEQSKLQHLVICFCLSYMA